MAQQYIARWRRGNLPPICHRIKTGHRHTWGWCTNCGLRIMKDDPSTFNPSLKAYSNNVAADQEECKRCFRG